MHATHLLQFLFVLSAAAHVGSVPRDDNSHALMKRQDGGKANPLSGLLNPSAPDSKTSVSPPASSSSSKPAPPSTSSEVPVSSSSVPAPPSSSSPAPSPTQPPNNTPSSASPPPVSNKPASNTPAPGQPTPSSDPTKASESSAASTTGSSTPGDNSNSSSPGMSDTTKKTIIGVVVGIGGAIVLGALAVVAWRVWGRRKQTEESDGLMDYDMSAGGFEKQDLSYAGAGQQASQQQHQTPFKSTLEDYHKPGQVTASSNF
ncbi:hypothetical protein VHEMI09170 [[Torrubiella] hemipterigena]|uniref:Mid2 domain-containing protein n=1 Tax=[Torrubiella] hemipterigena TaxID=1531966 RepID=A0A0A1TR15_9HYPO|nr:hypothetical protein VHEMI09170 [[Torrubiella] hemipterigena]